MDPYILITHPNARLFILRVPDGRGPISRPVWRTLLAGITKVMRHYRMQQRDIGYVEAFGPEGEGADSNFSARLDKAYSGDLTILPTFDLWDWQAGRFVLVRVSKVVIDSDTRLNLETLR